MEGNIKSFEDLDCWKQCRKLRIFVAKEILSALPKYEKYSLGIQIHKAARSTTANIAEGYGRFHYKDNAKFCSNSRGSCYEVIDHLITAFDEGLINNELYLKGRQIAERAIHILNGYINYLRTASE